MKRLQYRWGWFVGLGVLAACFGIAALILVVHATVATVYVIGALMIIAGGIEIILDVGSRNWGRFFLWIAAGLFYVIAGSVALARPLHAALALTLLLGIALIAAGIMRVAVGLHMETQARTAVVFGGGVTVLVGLLVLVGWPGDSVAILGTILGIDLLFTGLSWIGFGLRLRVHA